LKTDGAGGMGGDEMDGKASRVHVTRTGRISGEHSRQSPTRHIVSADAGQTERVSHAAERLADAIVLAARAPADPRTLSAWGQHVGVSRGTLRVWCRAARTPARASLDFLRMLRAVQLSQNQGWDLFSVLNVIDERSIGRLLERGRLRGFLRRTV